MDYNRPKFLFFLIFLLYITPDAFAVKAYLIYPAIDGIFCVKNPFNTNDDVYIQTSEYHYKPYYDSISDEFVIYVADKSVHQLVQGAENLCNDKSLSLSTVQEINAENIYVHDMISNVSPNNWLYKMAQTGREGVEEIFFIDNINREYENIIKLYLYNFSSLPNSFSIELNELKTDYSIHNRGDTVLYLRLSQLIEDNPKTLKLKIEGNAYDIGVLKIETDFMYDDFDASSYFPVYGNQTFISSALYFDRSKPGDDDYQVYYMENGCLRELNEPYSVESINEIIVTKENQIQELELHAYNIDVTETITDPDVLIVYHPVFTNQIGKYRDLLMEMKFGTGEIVTTNVVDLYCRYSAGQNTTTAIKKYLEKVTPEYLILIGDANMKSDTSDMIPAFSYPHIFTHSTFVSDYGYCYLDDPLKPQIAVSRLPFQKPNELRQHINKLKSKSARENENFSNTSILFNFENKAIKYDSSISLLQIERKEDIPKLKNDTLLENVKLVIHVGHGSYKGWKCLRADDFYEVVALQYPFEMIDLSCWVGCFSLNKRNCFSEKLLLHPDFNYTGILSSSGFISDRGSETLVNYFLMNPEIDNLSSLLLKFRQEYINDKRFQIEDLQMVNCFGSGF